MKVELASLVAQQPHKLLLQAKVQVFLGPLTVTPGPPPGWHSVSGTAGTPGTPGTPAGSVGTPCEVKQQNHLAAMGA